MQGQVVNHARLQGVICLAIGRLRRPQSTASVEKRRFVQPVENGSA
jgi:hypothetical protein